MAIYIVGFDGKWQERFDEPEEAISWAREVAATGRVVEVVRRRFGLHSFLTGFPDSEREALAARWRWSWFGTSGGGGDGGGSAGADGHRHHYGSAWGGHGGHGGGGHGGHGGGH